MRGLPRRSAGKFLEADKVKMLPDWSKLLRRAWSVRLALLSAALSAVEVALPIMAPSMPSGRFAIASAVVAFAAAVARLVAQPKMRDDDA